MKHAVSTLLLLFALLIGTLLCGIFTGCAEEKPPPQDDVSHAASGGASDLPAEPSPSPSPAPPPVDDIPDEAVLSGENESYGKAESDGDLKYRLVNDSFYEVIGLEKDKGAIKIPAFFGGKPVKRIGKTAFSLGKPLTVTLPEGIVEISDGAFQCCYKLRQISLPASLRRIGEGAFAEDHDLERITVAEGSRDFKSQDGVLFTADMKTLLVYPRGKLDESYMPPEGVTEIASLEMVGALTSLTLPEGLEKIALNGLDLETLTLPQSLREATFYGPFRCLRSLHLPKNLESVRFENYFPPYSYILRKCSFPLLREITVEEGNPTYSARDGVLFDKTGQTLLLYPRGKTDQSYTVPAGVKEIVEISETAALTELILPEGIEKIGRLASLHLTELVLPESLTELSALGGLEKLPVLHIPKNLVKLQFDHDAIPLGTRVVQGTDYRPSWFLALTAITVEEENPAYSARDGVLFDKTGKTLLCYPPGREAEVYTVPEGVEKIASSGLCLLFTKHLVLPTTVTSLSSGAIAAERVETISIPEGARGLGKRCILFYRPRGVVTQILCGPAERPADWDADFAGMLFDELGKFNVKWSETTTGG